MSHVQYPSRAPLSRLRPLGTGCSSAETLDFPIPHTINIGARSSSPRSARDCGTNAYTSSGKGGCGTDRVRPAELPPRRARASLLGAACGRSRAVWCAGGRRPSRRVSAAPRPCARRTELAGGAGLVERRRPLGRRRAGPTHRGCARPKPGPIARRVAPRRPDGNARLLHQREACGPSSPAPFAVGFRHRETSSHADPRALGVRAHRLPLCVRRPGTGSAGARGRRGPPRRRCDGPLLVTVADYKHMIGFDAANGASRAPHRGPHRNPRRRRVPHVPDVGASFSATTYRFVAFAPNLQ